MDAYLYLIPITILIVSVMALVLLWTIKNNQFSDQEGDKILFIEEKSDE